MHVTLLTYNMKKNISLSATYAYLYWMLGSYTSM